MYSSAPSPDGFAGVQGGGVGNVPQALIDEMNKRYKPRPVRGSKPSEPAIPAIGSADGFAGLDTSEMGGLRKRSDRNYQAGVERLKRDNPGALIQSGQAVIKNSDGSFKVVDKITDAERNRGMPKPSGKVNKPRNNSTKPGGGSQLSAVQPSIADLQKKYSDAYSKYDTAPGGGGGGNGGGGGGGGGNGRGEVRVSPTEVEQKGTNTGFKPMTLNDANALLSPGFSIGKPFSSNQLPTTGTNLYTKDPGDSSV